MNPTQHPSNNAVFGAPKDWDQREIPCGALAITRVTVDQVGPAMVSYWRPTDEEIIHLARGGLVALWIYGTTHPVVAMDVEPKK
jgi:S-adenosylhomocysteine hydrolase